MDCFFFFVNGFFKLFVWLWFNRIKLKSLNLFKIYFLALSSWYTVHIEGGPSFFRGYEYEIYVCPILILTRTNYSFLRFLHPVNHSPMFCCILLNLLLIQPFYIPSHVFLINLLMIGFKFEFGIYLLRSFDGYVYFFIPMNTNVARYQTQNDGFVFEESVDFEMEIIIISLLVSFSHL